MSACRLQLQLFVRAASLALAALLFCAAPGAGEAAGVAIRGVSDVWATAAGSPVYVDVPPGTGGRVAVTAAIGDAERFEIRRNTILPPGTAGRFELSMPSVGYPEVTCAAGGESVSRTLSAFATPGAEYEAAARSAFACVNGYLLREFESLGEIRKQFTFRNGYLAMDDLPGRWQSYVGVFNTMVMDAREAERLQPAQREAMALWVRWHGGRVWLGGENAASAAAAIGLDTAGKPSVDVAGVRCVFLNRGVVFLQAEPSAAAIGTLLRDFVFDRERRAARDPLEAFFPGGWGSANSSLGRRLAEPLGGVSTYAIVASLVLLGLIMGPLNYWYIRRKRNSLLLFITTPIIALVGTAGIFAVSFLSEGIGGGYTQSALFVGARDADDAMLYNALVVKPGFSAPTLRFDERSHVLPLVTAKNEYVLDAGDGLRLTSGWLKPRFPSGFIVARPVVRRMTIRIDEEEGRYYAVNDLGYRVDMVAAALPNGGHGVAMDIAPGARRPFERDSGAALDRLRRDCGRMLGGERLFENAVMAAKSDGLPYLESGGLDATRVEGSYYFCVLGDPEPEGRP